MAAAFLVGSAAASAYERINNKADRPRIFEAPNEDMIIPD
jgi:hypothetical protein